MYIYIYLNNFAVHLKLTQHRESTILQLRKLAYNKMWYYSKCLGLRILIVPRGLKSVYKHLLQVSQFKFSLRLHPVWRQSTYLSTHVRALLGWDQTFPVGFGSQQPLEGSQWPLEPVWKWTSSQMASCFHIPSACFLTVADTQEHPKSSREMGFHENPCYFCKAGDTNSWAQWRKIWNIYQGFSSYLQWYKKNTEMNGVFIFFQHSVPPGDKSATQIHPWRLRQVRDHRVVATQTDYSVSWDIVYVAAASLEEDHESPCSSLFHLIQLHVNTQCWMGKKTFQANDFNTVGTAYLV